MPPDDPVAITYPFANSTFTEPMIWQAEDDFAFRLTGGFAAHPGPYGTKTPNPNPMEPPEMMVFLEIAQQILSPYPTYASKLEPVTPELVSDTSAALEQNHIRMVLVDRTTPGAERSSSSFAAPLGYVRSQSGHFVIWTSRLGPL